MSGFDRFFNGRFFKLAVVFLWLVIFVLCLLNMGSFSIDSIVNFTPDNKLAAAGVMLLLFALKSVSVVVYSGVLFAALGVMFDLSVALPLALAGSFVIAALPYFIGRKLGGRQIERITEKYPRLRIVTELRTSNDFLFVLLARLIGILPYDIVSVYMGAAGISFKSYISGSILGMLQLAVPMTVMGYAAEDPSSPVFIISASVQLTISVVSFIAMIFFVKKVRGNSERH